MVILHRAKGQVANLYRRPLGPDHFLRFTSGVSSPETSSRPSDTLHSEAFLRGLMRRQLRLSIGCAAAFLLALLGLPWLNYVAPQWTAIPIGGFPLTWLLLGVLSFPFVWLIAAIFIRSSIRLEQAEVREMMPKRNSSPGIPEKR